MTTSHTADDSTASLSSDEARRVTNAITSHISGVASAAAAAALQQMSLCGATQDAGVH